MTSSESQIQFFALQGVTCAGCVRSISRAVETLQQGGQIEDFSINFADRTLVVSGPCPSGNITDALERAGYSATVLTSQADREDVVKAQERHSQKVLRRSYVALLCGALMMTVTMFDLQASISTVTGALTALLQAIISFAVMYYCAAGIYRGAWKSLTTRTFNMDSLIGLGTISAWGYSLTILILSVIDSSLVPIAAQHLYFEAAVMILGFILLGQGIESKVRGSTAKAVQSLVKLQPKSAWRREEGGEFNEVDVPLLVPGDVVLVKPGETIATDGEVIEGRSGVDESLLSGEALAQMKTAGDRLVGSTINGTGSLIYKVTQVGENTLLAQMVRQVRQAQNSKPALGKLADDIAAIFVPVVLGIALLTFILWWWLGPQGYWSYTLVATVSVLIIACPCALGLATPISTMVGVGLAAKRGILIQKGDALQVASKVTMLVLDKTGTITAGKPSVTDIMWLNEAADSTQYLEYLRALELHSEHPLARALIDYCDSQSATSLNAQSVKEFQAHVGQGVSATIDGAQIKVGSFNWLASNLNQQHRQCAEQWMEQAKSITLLSCNDQLVAMLAIADPLKNDSQQALATLQERGLKLMILSGDNQKSVAAVAKEVGISSYYGDLSASEKLQKIEQLQRDGEIVAMVGDGVNDAAALAVADLGCAIGQGTDVAIHSADITLINGSLTRLPIAIDISTKTLRNIKQNLFAAFIYNAIAIPLAAGALYPAFAILLNPMAAGIAMALSSISVVSNAYRLAISKV